jgi:hypothetical protein
MKVELLAGLPESNGGVRFTMGFRGIAAIWLTRFPDRASNEDIDDLAELLESIAECTRQHLTAVQPTESPAHET